MEIEGLKEKMRQRAPGGKKRTLTLNNSRPKDLSMSLNQWKYSQLAQMSKKGQIQK